VEGIHAIASGRVGRDRLLPGAGFKWAWTGTTSCSSFIGRAAAPAWQGLRATETADGCHQWRATRPARAGDSWISGGTVWHNRETKFCSLFRATLPAGGIKPIPLPARSPYRNAYAARWVRSAQEECLAKLVWFDEASLRRARTEFIDHYHSDETTKKRVTSYCSHTTKWADSPGAECAVVSALAGC
jgi:hypothetical protein